MHAPSLRREVLRLSWPVVVQQLSRTLMFLVDTAMLKDVGTTAIATMGIVGPVFYTLIQVLTALGIGANATVARAWGEGDREKQRREAGTAVAVALLSGGAALAAAWWGLPALLRLFEVPGKPEIVGGAVAYMRIVSWCLPIVLLDFAASSILRAAGDTRTPMIAAVIANVTNVALNYVLIFGHFGFPRMEVRGAAVASAVSLSLQGLITFGYMASRWSPIRVGLADLGAATWESAARLVRVTTPALVEPVVLQSGFLVFTKFVTMLGEASLSAHRSAISVESLSFMPGFGVSMACAAIVGQYLGAKRPDIAERANREAVFLGVGLMSVIGVAFFVVPGALLWPFAPRDIAEPWGLASQALRIAAFEQPFMAAAMVLAGTLRGAGDTRSPVAVGFLGVWLIRVPLAYLLAHVAGMGLAGIWWTMVADWAVRAAAFWWLVRRGRWKSVRL